MVIQREDGQLCLTTQVEHARLAAELVDHWGGPFAPVEPADAVRLAAELHDGGWAEVDAAPQVNPQTQRPYSFLDIPQDVHVAAHSRTVQRARAAHPYAGLLTSLHSTGLYRNRYGHLPHIPQRPVDPASRAAVDRFLAEQDELQAELLRSLQPDPRVLWTHYRWFQLWDMLSLYSCMLSPGDVRRELLCRVPLRPGGDEVDLYLVGAGEATFQVQPWPFRDPRIELTWAVRRVPDRPYGSDAELQTAWRRAPVQRRRVTLVA